MVNVKDGLVSGVWSRSRSRKVIVNSLCSSQVCESNDPWDVIVSSEEGNFQVVLDRKWGRGCHFGD